MRHTPLTLLAVVLLMQSIDVMAQGPSDTNNLPGTTPPQPGGPPGAPPTTASPKTPPPGQTPGATPAPAPTPPTPPPPATPPPGATTPSPTTAPPKNATNQTTSPPRTPTPTSVPTQIVKNDAQTPTAIVSTESESSGGLSAGAVVGIVIACLGLVAIIVFFAYRHLRARREDAKHYDHDGFPSSPPMTVLESSRGADHKFSIMGGGPSFLNPPRRHESPSPDVVVMMHKPSTMTSPQFSQELAQTSPLFEQDVADFTKPSTKLPPNESNELSSSYRESYAESYAESYGGANSFMHSFDHGTLGRETMNSTLDEDHNTDEANNNNHTSHWMDAMDEDRHTNDSYAMLEAGAGSYGSGRGSAMRFSTDSDFSTGHR